jgi:carbon starvation protein
MGKLKYSWMTAVPGFIMAVTTMYAGYLNITLNYLPKQNYLLAGLSVIVMVLIMIVIVEAVKRWFVLLKIKIPVKDPYGDLVLEVVEE